MVMTKFKFKYQIQVPNYSQDDKVAEKNWTKHSFSFLIFIVFDDLERKNEFNGNLASNNIYLRLLSNQLLIYEVDLRVTHGA